MADLRTAGSRRRRSGNLAMAVAMPASDRTTSFTPFGALDRFQLARRRKLPDAATGWVLAACRGWSSGRKSCICRDPPLDRAGRWHDRPSHGTLGQRQRKWRRSPRAHRIAAPRHLRRMVRAQWRVRRRSSRNRRRKRRDDRLHHRLHARTCSSDSFNVAGRLACARPMAMRRRLLTRTMAFTARRAKPPASRLPTWCGRGSWRIRGLPTREELASACAFLTGAE